jgi:P-type Ca2+ transporter type 2C
LLALVVNWPVAQTIFHMRPLSALDWVLAASIALSILVVEETRKFLVRRL